MDLVVQILELFYLKLDVSILSRGYQENPIGIVTFESIL